MTMAFTFLSNKQVIGKYPQFRYTVAHTKVVDPALQTSTQFHGF